jgi:hypothetical protein
MSYRGMQPTCCGFGSGRLQQEIRRSGGRRLGRPWPENGRSAIEEEEEEEEEDDDDDDDDDFEESRTARFLSIHFASHFGRGMTPRTEIQSAFNKTTKQTELCLAPR